MSRGYLVISAEAQSITNRDSNQMAPHSGPTTSNANPIAAMPRSARRLKDTEDSARQNDFTDSPPAEARAAEDPCEP